MTTTGSDIVKDATAFSGQPYLFGAELTGDAVGPVDCSELVEAVCRRLEVDPPVPDGAYFQYRHCARADLLVPVEEGIRTPGVLLFLGPGGVATDGNYRRRIYHVAISVGDSRHTIEARTTGTLVGAFPVRNRGWTFAGRIPGVDYSDSPIIGMGIEEAVGMLAEVSLGSRGADVRRAQAILSDVFGLRGVVGKTDGVFGPRTDKAVRMLQARYALTVDGIVGERTWTALLDA